MSGNELRWGVLVRGDTQLFIISTIHFTLNYFICKFKLNVSRVVWLSCWLFFYCSVKLTSWAWCFYYQQKQWPKWAFNKIRCPWFKSKPHVLLLPNRRWECSRYHIKRWQHLIWFHPHFILVRGEKKTAFRAAWDPKSLHCKLKFWGRLTVVSGRMSQLSLLVLHNVL